MDFTNHGLRAGKPLREALLDAGQVRLRPILMTTSAMIFGMLPMAIGMGDGGELMAPMGRAVIGGIITSTLLTLVVVPVLFTFVHAIDKWAKARLYHDVDEGIGPPRTAGRQRPPAQSSTARTTDPRSLQG